MKKYAKILIGLAIAGIAAYKLADMYKKGDIDKLIKKFIKVKEPLAEGLYTKEQFRLIAQGLTNHIEKTENRISKKNHHKNQKKYDDMNWSQKVISRLHDNLN